MENNIENLQKKIATESVIQMEKQIEQLKRDIFDLSSRMDLINSMEPEKTSKEQFEKTIREKKDELAGLEKSIKITAKTMDPNYTLPVEETVGSFKTDGTPVVSMESKFGAILEKVNGALNEIKKERADVTEDILKNLTHEVNEHLYKEDSVENKTRIEKLEELTKLLSDNEASFVDQFPGLDINNDKPIVFNDPHYQREYEILQNENKNLKEDIAQIHEELKNVVNNK